jgi:hypothetical protein
MGAPRGNKNAAGPHKSFKRGKKTVSKRSSGKRIKNYVAYQTRKQNKIDRFGNSNTIFFSQKENVKRIKSGKRKAKELFPYAKKRKR